MLLFDLFHNLNVVRSISSMIHFVKYKVVRKNSSNQEEPDTKVILHSAHAISTTKGSIILRSSSGVNDIIIAISLIDASKRVLVD